MKRLLALLLCITPCAALVHPMPPYVAVIGYTGSMQPALMGGERIRVLPVLFEDVKRGMAVVMADDARDMLISHRVISAGHAANGRKYVITKGDANRYRDPIPWAAADYCGVLDITPRAP